MAFRGISKRMESLFAHNNINHSKSDARAAKAQEWVEKEVSKLVEVINSVGHRQGNGQVTVTFGELFRAYQDISDTLVGILVRARKRKLLHYDGHMLFQGTHDHVVITLLNGHPPPTSGVFAGVRTSVRNMFGMGRVRSPPPSSRGGPGEVGKYQKMLKAGLSREAVQHKMNLDGVDPMLLPAQGSGFAPVPENGPGGFSASANANQRGGYSEYGSRDRMNNQQAALSSPGFQSGTGFDVGGGTPSRGDRRSRTSRRQGPRRTRQAPSKFPEGVAPAPARPVRPAQQYTPDNGATNATRPRGPKHFDRVSKNIFSSIAALIQSRKAQKNNYEPSPSFSANESGFQPSSSAATFRKGSNFGGDLQRKGSAFGRKASAANEPSGYRKGSAFDGGYRKTSAANESSGYRKGSAFDGGYRKTSAANESSGYRKGSAFDGGYRKTSAFGGEVPARKTSAYKESSATGYHKPPKPKSPSPSQSPASTYKPPKPKSPSPRQTPASTYRKPSVVSELPSANSGTGTMRQKPRRPERERKSRMPRESRARTRRIDVPRQSRRPRESRHPRKAEGRHGVKSLAKRFGGNATPSPNTFATKRRSPKPLGTSRFAPTASRAPKEQPALASRRQTQLDRPKPVAPAAGGDRNFGSPSTTAGSALPPSKERKSHFPRKGTVDNLKSLLAKQNGFGISQPSYDSNEVSTFTNERTNDREGFVPPPSFEFEGSPIEGQSNNWNDNGGSNWNDNGNSDWNDNGDSNWNDNGNTDWNDNGDSNWNDNGDSNWNDNGDSNWNDNGDSNWNDNGDSNWNDNGDSNWNDNGNSDWNDNGDSNWNDNGDPNWNDNGNSDWNDNGDSNWNDNGNSDWNDNGDSNWNDNNNSNWDGDNDWNDGGGANFNGEGDWNGDGTGGDGWDGGNNDWNSGGNSTWNAQPSTGYQNTNRAPQKQGGFMSRLTTKNVFSKFTGSFGSKGTKGTMGTIQENGNGQNGRGGGYDQGGYDQGGYDQGGYDQGGYDQGGYDQGGYDQGGYDQGGYDQGGYDQGGYDQGGYDQGGYDSQGNGNATSNGGKSGAASDPIYAKYYTMLKVGLPRGAIEQAMARDEVDPSGFQW